MEDEFWSLKQVEVPHRDYAVWLIQRRRILVVGCNAQLGVL
jgi:hypothetical protein